MVISFLFIVTWLNGFPQTIRQEISLNDNWYSVADDTNPGAYDGFEYPSYRAVDWELVDVPHNWDKYEGYRRMLHGNRHGYAWYRKIFTVDNQKRGKRYFLFFEGVGSYATVWLNGKKVGFHAGGRTTFTLDITDVIHVNNQSNLLAVRADHPAQIRDLPWVCGGCSDEWGFSEGSQPMGIFRPVHLIITGDLRIEPFGVHIWNDTTASEKRAIINSTIEVKNYSQKIKKITLVCRLVDKEGNTVKEIEKVRELVAGELAIINSAPMQVDNPRLWSIGDPYLYTLESKIVENGKILDQVSTKYGIRWISWPVNRNDGDNRFYLNGKPVFINGTAEYEHMLGQSHAFTDEQVRARVMQIKAAGFNAFRDAHQPHNLRYQENWDSLGILFWPQMAAHIWYDTPEFRENFKGLLRDWVKERRNCPSVILWGLENESTLPTDFAEECMAIIREMDPASPSQRLVTTCNGGTGTDWNVVQNWSGTYTGELYDYDKDIGRELLNGEYGAWRSIDLHTEGPFKQEVEYSEDRMAQLMETKVLLAEKSKDQCCGHFQWIFNSHDNPGRTQNGEGLRELDRVGPVNYKGLITPWAEPLDVYYMYRANYAPKETEPMVYIVSHTWPNRWIKPGIKNSIVVYSNCDEVELYNDVKNISLGKKTRNGTGTHFQWDSVDIQYNVLRAVGYVKDQIVAEDVIILHHLPESPNFKTLFDNITDITTPQTGYNYIYRINCGGPDYTDEYGNTWLSDQHKEEDDTWGSLSWTDDFPGLPPFYASQRRTFDPIIGTKDWELFQTFRYGRDKLRYEFQVPNGEYMVDFYFIEPWYGIGGGLDCEGWRIFDVAVNGETVIEALDIWKEAGHDKALKKSFITKVSEGQLAVTFPKIISGQAVISAIAIASKNDGIMPVNAVPTLIKNLAATEGAGDWIVKSWLDIGDRQYADDSITFGNIPSNFYGADWIMTSQKEIQGKDTLASFTLGTDADVFICMDGRIKDLPVWLEEYTDQKAQVENGKGDIYKVYAKRFSKNSNIKMGANGIITEGKANMYTVVVCPVYNLGQAADQRPLKSCQAEDAVLIGKGLKRNAFENKEYVKFTRAEADTVEWEFSVGLGDTYTLKFAYLNNIEQVIPMQLTITDANGIIVKDEILQFPPHKNSWRTVSTTTGTSINAGKYKAKLTSVGKTGLGIDRMEVQ